MTAADKIDILLVDDRPENLLALEAVLSDTTYNLIKVSSGEEALKYLLHHQCALILMDVQMPGMDGFETATLVKQNSRTRETPIIFITAIHMDEHFVYEGYKSGAVDYIFKPFDPEILRSKVAVFAELHRSRNEIRRQADLLLAQDRWEQEQALAQLEIKSLKREQSIQQKYRDLVDGIDNGIIWSVNADSMIFTYVSPSAERLLGYSSEIWQSEESFLMNRIHPDDRVTMSDSIHQTLLSHRPQRLEHRMIRADGSVAWFQTSLRATPRQDRNELELRGLSVEVTRIKDTQEALRRSEEQSRLLAEASLLLSESLEIEGPLQKLAERMVPRIADEVSIHFVDDGKIAKLVASWPLRPKYPPRDVSASPRRASIALQNRGRIVGFLDLEMTHSGRALAPGDMPMIDDLARRIALAIDNAKLYAEAQAAIRTRDDFLSIASHELKTPLTPLMLQNQMLIRTLKQRTTGEVSSETVSKIAQTSSRQLARLSRLIEDLLDVSRLDNGRLDLSPEDFDLVDLVREVVERFREQLAVAQCEVQISASQPVVGRWDRFRIEQVIVNLLTNAIKYGQGKPITIEVRPDGGTARVQICDKGIGIDSKDQERIFSRFERAVSSSHFGGLGLGLYIVKQILKLHQGKIQVESSPGQGSAFTVILPLAIPKMAERGEVLEASRHA